MSPSCSRYVLQCGGPSIPWSAVFSLPANKLSSILDMNQHIRSYLGRKERPHTRIISLSPDLRSRGESPGQEPGLAEIRLKLILPQSVVNREGEKAGLVIFLGDERGSQQVDNRWCNCQRKWFSSHWLSRWGCDIECLLPGDGYGAVLVDIRGSGGQGQEWRSLRSGEMSDLEQVLVFLTSLESVDADRLCVLGSGWGGWLVLAALLANTPGLGQVRCGLARAPLTDWRLGRRSIQFCFN